MYGIQPNMYGSRMQDEPATPSFYRPSLQGLFRSPGLAGALEALSVKVPPASDDAVESVHRDRGPRFRLC